METRIFQRWQFGRWAPRDLDNGGRARVKLLSVRESSEASAGVFFIPYDSLLYRTTSSRTPMK
jgi:hypothetical protein